MGYTGGKTKNPTYNSVCRGDGHTEAVKLQFDPSVLSYETLISLVLDQASASCYGGRQYQSAVWVQNDEQRAVVQRVAAKLGKQAVPVFGTSAWYDAEAYHQKYYS